MRLKIDPRSEIAVYDQIIRQVKFAIADEMLAAGELVPSVRQLAHRLAINPNTVARAYRALHEAGVLVAVRGTGLVVAPTARRQCQNDRLRLLRARFRAVFDEAAHSGLETSEIVALVQAEVRNLQRAKRS